MDLTEDLTDTAQPKMEFQGSHNQEFLVDSCITDSELKVEFDERKSYIIVPASKLLVAIDLVARVYLPSMVKSVRHQLLPALGAFLANSFAKSLASVQKIPIPMRTRQRTKRKKSMEQEINKIEQENEKLMTDEDNRTKSENALDRIQKECEGVTEQDNNTKDEQGIPEKCVDCRVLYEPSGEIIADVVFVHGLHGGLDRTWKQGTWRQTNTFKLKNKKLIKKPSEKSNHFICDSDQSPIRRRPKNIDSKIPTKIFKINKNNEVETGETDCDSRETNCDKKEENLGLNKHRKILENSIKKILTFQGKIDKMDVESTETIIAEETNVKNKTVKNTDIMSIDETDNNQIFNKNKIEAENEFKMVLEESLMIKHKTGTSETISLNNIELNSIKEAQPTSSSQIESQIYSINVQIPSNNSYSNTIYINDNNLEYSSDNNSEVSSNCSDSGDLEDFENYSNCWPKDWLPVDCPQCRIVTINYTTDVLWCPVWQRKRNRTNLVERSYEMTDELLRMGLGSRPIIWVGHSKGGLFIKQIILNGFESRDQNPTHYKLYEKSRAIMFYSVPHKGSSLADVTFPFFRRSVELLEIKRNCDFVLGLHKRFLDIFSEENTNKPEIFSFIDTVATKMGIMNIEMIAYESADPDIGTKCDVPLNHREICKPAGRDCLLYQELVELIRRCL